MACANGPWEGRYLDFKMTLDSGDRSAFGKMLKLLLAFANTPRNREAYIIYGVRENEGSAEHVGVDSFPAQEQIEQLIREYTDLDGVVVDTDFELAGKRTPYVAVPLQYRDGPYCLKRNLRDATHIVRPGRVYLRNGSCIALAGERERLRKKGWSTWFLDGRYVSNTDEMRRMLEGVLPEDHRSTIVGNYIRLDFRLATSRLRKNLELR
jgi:hypothetical protein